MLSVFYSFRYFFTAIKFWQYRRKLKQYLIDPKKVSAHITDLKQDYLTLHHIKVLVLDFDGVLNSYGENTVLEEVFVWLKNIIHTKPNIKICILSNRANKIREEYFLKRFPEITFITNIRKKPYTDGLEKLLAGNLTLEKQEILIVDDRLATGILAAEIFGCNAILITKPYINYKKKPLIESFFTILRIIERAILNML